MSAFERAERDERDGDLGSARRRTTSYIGTVGYAPELCERIARLSMRMGDPVEAGRWYFACDSRDDGAGAAIERFTAACGGIPQQILSQLPVVTRRSTLEAFPPVARRRLEDLGFRGPPAEEHLRGERPSRMGRILVKVGCLAGMLVGLLFALIMVVGFVVVIDRLIDIIT